MSYIYDKLKRDGDNYIAQLSHICMKLKKLRKYYTHSDSSIIPLTEHECREKIKGLTNLVDTYKRVYDDYGMLTQELADNLRTQFRCYVVYYELTYEMLALYDDTPFYAYISILPNGLFVGKYEKIRIERGPLSAFVNMAIEDKSIIDRVVKRYNDWEKEQRSVNLLPEWKYPIDRSLS